MIFVQVILDKFEFFPIKCRVQRAKDNRGSLKRVQSKTFETKAHNHEQNYLCLEHKNDMMSCLGQLERLNLGFSRETVRQILHRLASILHSSHQVSQASKYIALIPSS
jgi:hypothetical protein